MQEEWGSWMLGVFGEEEKGKKKMEVDWTRKGRKNGAGCGEPPPPLFNGRLWPKNKNQSGGRGRKKWGENLWNWGGAKWGENQKWEESAKTLQWPAAGKKGKINK